MANKKKLNLQFGAEIKELIVEPQSQHFKSTDGIEYSYEKYKANPTISKLMAKGFQYTQSPNSNLKARKKTNSAINISINKFLKWIEEINYTGQLDRNLLLNYKNFLIDNHVSWSVYSYYTVIARICSVLIEKGLIPSFIVPKNISLQQAKNSSRTGKTIASTISTPNLDKKLNADDINEKVLGLIVDSVWNVSFHLFDLLEKGQQLINEPINELIEYDSKMSREEALYSIIKNMYFEFKGLSDKFLFTSRFKGYSNKNFITIMNKYVTANQKNKWCFSSKEINCYLNPSKDLVNCILILLSAAQVNPESAYYLDINCLENDLNEDIVRLSWIKHRAGGVQKSIPFPKGKHPRAKTIPNVIVLFKKYSSSLRKEVSTEMQERLFIWKGFQANKVDKITTYFNSGKVALIGLIPLIKKDLILNNKSSLELDIALTTCNEINFSLIRTTAINIASKRLNRDISNLAIMDGRKSETSLTEHYLNNDSTSEHFDSQIREAQNLMYDWASSKPIIVSNKEEIIKTLNISEETATQIINDDFNNGYGASLINEHVIIIDSALNALRMIQWLKKLDDSESKMLDTNPERWNTVYLPQKKLFNEALGFISKKNKQEALKMNKEFNLPFPEVL